MALYAGLYETVDVGRQAAPSYSGNRMVPQQARRSCLAPGASHTQAASGAPGR